MLEVAEVHVIRHKVLVEGLSQRQVAQQMGVSRNTVRKYLEIGEPRRVEAEPRPKPVVALVSSRIDELLEEWRDRTTPKQRITGSRVHQQLLSEGFDVGITTVREYLRERKRRHAEVYVPLVHRPGDEAQIDFFEVVVDVGGERRKAWMFVMRLMYSGRDFAWLYDRCDQVSFLDGHVRAFTHFGGVPHRCIYDNLKPAVSKLLLPRRELTGRFLALVSHYLFEPAFARPGTGHDKGGVEARGKGIRLGHLTPIPTGPSLPAIAALLLARLDADIHRRKDEQGRTVAARFEQERVCFMPLRQAFDPRKVVPVSISRSARVRVDGAYYSVPSAWASLDATAYVGPCDLQVVCRGETVTHPRKAFGQRSIRYRHYLPELARKPQAVRQVAPELLGELGPPFDQLWRLLVDTHGPGDGARVFARVLGAVVDHGEETVSEAVRRALDTDRLDLVALVASPAKPPQQNAVPAFLAAHEVESARAADFDRLLAGGDHE